MRLIFFVAMLLTSFNSFAINYKLIETDYKGVKVKYYQDTNKHIIDTSFKLKESQDTEILYVFSYNCSVCYVFEDYASQLAEYSKENKIRFEKIPFYVGKEDLNKVAATMFFSRKFLNFNDDFDSAIFDLIHINNVSVKTKEDLEHLFVEYAKVDKKTIESKEYKYKMNYRLNRVDLLLKELEVSTTPTFIIHKSGKRFMIDATTAETPDNLLFTLFAIMAKN